MDYSNSDLPIKRPVKHTYGGMFHGYKTIKERLYKCVFMWIRYRA